MRAWTCLPGDFDTRINLTGRVLRCCSTEGPERARPQDGKRQDLDVARDVDVGWQDLTTAVQQGWHGEAAVEQPGQTKPTKALEVGLPGEPGIESRPRASKTE